MFTKLTSHSARIVAWSFLIVGACFSTNSYANDCYKEASSVTAVLFDISDPLNEPSALAFDSLITRLVEEVEEGGRLDIYFIKDGIKVTGNPSGFFCKPSRPFGGGGELFFKKKLQTQFIGPAIATLRNARTATSSSKESPIVESIFNVGLKSFSETARPKKSWGKVVVISDLLQNSKVVSFYSGVPRYQNLSGSRDFNAWTRPLERVGLELILLNSETHGALQGRDLISFWGSYGAENFCAVKLSPISKALKGWKVDDCRQQ